MRASALGEELIGRAVANKAPRGFGDLASAHTWTFTLDAGETLAKVGTIAGTSGRVWHVPSDQPRSQDEVALELSRLLNRPLTIQATPRWLLRLIGLFRPEAGAMAEMVYEFEQPFVVSDAATRRVLGLAHTPFAKALEATVRWYASPLVAPALAPASP